MFDSNHDQIEHRRLVHVVRMGFGAVLLLVLVLSAVSLVRLNEFNNKMVTIVEIHNKKVVLAFGMRDAIRQRAISIYIMLATDDIFLRDEELLRFYSYAGEYRNRRQELGNLGVDDRERKIYKILDLVTERAQPANRKTAELLMQDISESDISETLEKGLREQKRLLDLLDELIRLQQKYTENAVQSNRNDYQFIWVMQFVLGITILIVGILIARFVIHNVRTKSFELNKKNSELEQAYKNAKQATKSKSTFLANMSHEIRTPMTGVLGMLDLLRETKLVSEQKYFIDTAYNSAEALLVVINDVLDFSKIEAGKIDYEAILFDIRHLLEEVIGLYAKDVQDKGIDISIHIEGDVSEFVRGDPTRLRQILNNLISNAVKFTNEGEIFVGLERVNSEQDPSGIMLRFKIVDTGIGIPVAAQKIIFGSFTQADESTTRKFGGTGLGLSISKQMTKLFGGEIGVESEEGSGSTFWFTAELPPSDRRLKCRENARFKGLTVFILAKSNGAEKAISSLVQYWGCTVVRKKSNTNCTDNPEVDVAFLDVDLLLSRGITDINLIISDVVNAKYMIGMFRLSDGDVTEKVKYFQFDASLARPVRRSSLLEIFSRLGGSRDEVISRSERSFPLVRKINTGVSVLLVDDNAVNQQVTIAILQKQGFVIDIANDGLQAFILYKSHNYDVVLMDCQMPVMDGFEATRNIRSFENEHGRPRTPIIALTANASETDRKACLDSGMDDFLVKPMRIKTVIDVFSHYLSVSVAGFNESNNESGTIIGKDISSHFDLNLLSELEDILDHDQLTEVVTLFIKHSGNRINELSSAIHEMNAASIESVSHSLKGSSANLGAKKLSEMCDFIVDSIRRGEIPPNIDTLHIEIQKEFALVSEYLHNKISVSNKG